MWKDTSDGRFATKSAWQLVHTGHTIQAVYIMIWSSIIPTTFSFFCWRLWQGLIPVDVVIQRRIRSHMASRCQCCSAIETIQQLFIDSSITDQFVRHGHIHMIVPLLILWIIWTAKNDANLLVYSTSRILGSYKVNTDGCLKKRFASGWRIIRDSSSQCVRVFLSSYSKCPILEVELRAILDGIILAQRIVLLDLWIESDSTLAIHCITRGGEPWSIQATLRHIRHLLAFDHDIISHIYREDN
ncbi:RNase H family protein [Abeliophyllum distichum]|uniref:RNase H family protein n=1 Tax=Abeliophyllum distichum TaxID=126358 RepID=A0ABD1V976_9LAMI